MTEALRSASLGTQVVAYAYFALLSGGLILTIGASLLGRLKGKATRPPKILEAVVGIGVVIGIPAVFSAAAALLVTPMLLAMPLPLAGWLLIGAFAIYGFWGSEASGSEMGGCSKMIGVSISGFGLCWAGSAILLADPPADNAASLLRPLLIAAPVAIFLGKHSRGRRAKQTIGFMLLIAVLCAIAFLPVEHGFAGNLLPASDWLRFPMAGAVAFGLWPLLSIPINLLVGKRAIRWREASRAILGLALVGGLFGLVWAVTRLLF